MVFFLAQAAQAVASSDAGAMAGLGAAVAVVLMFAGARLLPFFGAWLVKHNHPVLAEAVDVVAIYEQARESGKDRTEALDVARHSTEGKDLIAQAVAHFGASK